MQGFDALPRYIKYGNTKKKELYKCVNVFLSMKFLILYQIGLGNLVFHLYYVQVIFQLSSIITPRNFVEVTTEMTLS